MMDAYGLPPTVAAAAVPGLAAVTQKSIWRCATELQLVLVSDAMNSPSPCVQWQWQWQWQWQHPTVERCVVWRVAVAEESKQQARLLCSPVHSTGCHTDGSTHTCTHARVCQCGSMTTQPAYVATASAAGRQ
jgi:hypothetical protein